ncbi:MAG: M48 family metalloprotease [Armatimonadetes bacterium]|nr:M48 family metalloprotease [Armatimonadota bacterium]
MTRTRQTVPRRLRWMVLGALLLLGGAAGSLPGAQAAVTPEEELRVGQEAAAALESRFGRLVDPGRLRRVLSVGRRLETAAGRRPGGILFRILDSPEFNALALPGGLIYVTRGLVDTVGSDDELAAALAHEMAHVLLGHTRQLLEEAPEERSIVLEVENPGPNGSVSRRVVRSEASTTVRDARRKELDADREALPLLKKAGFRPEAAVMMLQRLKRPDERQPTPGSERLNPETRDFLSTHPTPDERIRNVQTALRALRGG